MQLPRGSQLANMQPSLYTYVVSAISCTLPYNITLGFLLPLWVAETMMRVRRALWLVLGMLSLSLLLVVLGVYITTRTESLTVSGYTSGVIVS